jgi:Pentapeptide repeats (8 copies)
MAEISNMWFSSWARLGEVAEGGKSQLQQERGCDGDHSIGTESAADTSEFEPPKYLSSLIGAINDGAKAAQGGTFLYLLVGLYLLAAAFGTTDEDLLLGKAVTIAQIGASLPVSFSFSIAPLVFVFLHIYTLVRYDMLAANVRQFSRDLPRAVREEVNRERCRQLLANLEFLMALTAPPRSPLYSKFWPWLFRVLVAVFPVSVLLIVQIIALRYQSDLITNANRFWLALDLAGLVLFFGRNPICGGDTERLSRWRRIVRWSLLIGLPPLLVGLNYAWLGTVPADADRFLVRYDPHDSHWDKKHPRPSWRDVAREPLDLLLCPELKWGCRFLRVDHRTLIDKVWDDKAMADLGNAAFDPHRALTEIDRATAEIDGVVLRGRSLRFAVLDESRLYAADLMGADLSQASLYHINLINAQLDGAHLKGANLKLAILRGVSGNNAQMGGRIY